MFGAETTIGKSYDLGTDAGRHPRHYPNSKAQELSNLLNIPIYAMIGHGNILFDKKALTPMKINWNIVKIEHKNLEIIHGSIVYEERIIDYSDKTVIQIIRSMYFLDEQIAQKINDIITGAKKISEKKRVINPNLVVVYPE